MFVYLGVSGDESIPQRQNKLRTATLKIKQRTA